jgi:hypothetical protein
MNTTKTNMLTITMVLSIVSIGMVGSQPVEAIIDWEIEPYMENNGFGMGYSYQCGSEYSYASGLTILTIAKTVDGDYVSILSYYDAFDMETQDYELVASYEHLGNQEVMDSLNQFWIDRNLSSTC